MTRSPTCTLSGQSTCWHGLFRRGFRGVVTNYFVIELAKRWDGIDSSSRHSLGGAIALADRSITANC